jgi:starch synthase
MPEATPADKLSIVFAAAEVAPFSKTGGLGEVMMSLPKALAARGHDVCVFAPLYNSSWRAGLPITPLEVKIETDVDGYRIGGRICRSHLPGCDVPVYLVEHHDYFSRDDKLFGHTLYQFRATEGYMQDYPDNDARFVFLTRAILEALPALGIAPDIINANDWHTGLLPIYLHTHYRSLPALAATRTVFTIHNLAYQGRFSKETMWTARLGWELFRHDLLEFHDGVNFMKAGIVGADAVTTVSRRYAEEITWPEHGEELDSTLRAHREKLIGINNGVDYSVWNPASDRFLVKRYGPEDVREGKAACKADLQAKAILPRRPDVPVVAMVTRLAEQKGVSLVRDAAHEIMRMGVQFIILGTGDPEYHGFFRYLAQQYPHQVAAALEFNESLAHQVTAGADIFLMPSRFEPSGLNQLYGLKYGTVPVVRETGGLVDTVIDCNDQTWATGIANGFRFSSYDASGLLWALRRAVDCFHQAPQVWLQLQRNGMAQDWSWERGAERYEGVYRKIMSGAAGS